MKARIADIEVLRALAVVLVVFHHAIGNVGLEEFKWIVGVYSFAQGWVGVDLFLVISGFVIARDLVPRLHLASKQGGAWKEILLFWNRRAWRLLPSAWFWLAIMLLASAFFNKSGVWGSVQANFEATLAGFFYYANIRFAQTFMLEPYGASFVYWSLSLEEQFYFIFPLLVIFSRKWLVFVLLGLIFISMPWQQGIYQMALRTDALFLGVLLAIWSRHEAYFKFEPRFLHKKVFGRLFFLLLIFALVHVGSFTPVAPDILAWVAFVIVWVASYGKSYFGITGWLSSGLQWLGARSYAIYLVHIPVFFILRETLFRYSGLEENSPIQIMLITMAALFFIVVVSDLNYRFLESPLRVRGERFARNIYNRKVDQVLN